MEKAAEFPSIKIGDKDYVVKFTRGKLYDLSKAGIDFAPTFKRNGSQANIVMNRAQAIDVLHCLIEYPGTARELAEVLWDRSAEIIDVLWASWVKAFPPAPAKPATAQELADSAPITETKQ
jgi:hypothetical protein